MLIFQLVRLPAEGQKKWNLGANNAVSGSTSEDLSEYRSNRQLQLNSLPVNTAGLQTGAEHSPPSPPGVCLKTREYGMEVIYSNSDQDYECRDCQKKDWCDELELFHILFDEFEENFFILFTSGFYYE